MTGRGRRSGAGPWLGWSIVVALGALHGWALWTGMGGRAGLSSPWPIWRDDHPLYYHSALVTRHFLRATGTTAGYDPSFMSGYAKSVVFPASSTLPELVVWAFGGSRPERAYKVYVLVAAALVPWLAAWAAALWRARGEAVAVAVGLFLVYVWTDFPINYAGFGMLPYFLAMPLGLAATAAFVRYLEGGGAARWLAATALMIAVVLVHLTGAMIVAPAAALAYLAIFVGRGSSGRTFSWSRHLGVWAIPALVLAANAFWWLPGVWLASTKGPSDFAFVHPEGVDVRLRQIVTEMPPIESLLGAAGLVGLGVLARRDRIGAWGLAGYVGAGFFWGYLSAGFRALDFLQPGRHTYAFYSGLAVASGVAVAETLGRLAEHDRGRLARGVALGLLLVAGRVFGPSLDLAVRARVSGPRPFLDSRPSPRLVWVVDRVKRHMKPGERLLYEEGGIDVPGEPDPYDGGRFSGLLPERAGVEVLGGPYLRASLVANFTQFGGGRLFGQERWGRDHFVRYARLYRPSAILCWTRWARGFCRSNPDLVEVVEDDGEFLFGKVVGFPGAAIEGQADVAAEPGRLVVRGATAGVDGTVVLRYHSVPCLSTSPPAWWEPVFLEQDPSPFIRLRPPEGALTIEIRFPPPSRRDGRH